MLKISQQLLEQLNNNSVRYLHWKGSNHFTDGFCGKGDVDLLVHEGDKDKLYALLKALGFLRPETQVFLRHPQIEDWIGMDKPTGTLIHLHLHFRAVFGKQLVNEYTFLPYDVCFELAREQEGCMVQDPAVEFLILLCRIFTGALKNEDKIKANFSYLRANTNEADFRLSVTRCGLSGSEADRLYALFEQEQPDVQPVAGILKKLIKKERSFPALRQLKRRLQYETYRRIFPRSLSRFTKKALSSGGARIAFVGQDGAGKSTVTRDIGNWLRWKLEVRNFYLGSGEHYRSPQRSLAARLPHNGVFRPLAALLVVSDYRRVARLTLKTLRKTGRYLKNGGIALFDRYPQAEVPGINDGAKIRTFYLPKVKGKLPRACVEHAAKREEHYLALAAKIAPDLLIKLMLPPEESLRRKPEEDPELVAKKHQVIRSLSFGAKDVRTVDVTRPYETELVEIKNIIWDHLTGQG